jgi:uncharacterized protein (DUF58 family)
MPPPKLPAELVHWPLEIAVRKLADDLRFGQDRSPYMGPGIEYVQSRPYVDGDSVRDFDWRVTARTGRPYVKQYEAFRTTPVYLLVDTSASMAFSSVPMSKHHLAGLIAGGLGLAALARLSPVGMIACGRRRLHFPPSLSRARVFQWLCELRLSRWDEATALAARIDELGKLLRSTSAVVVLSDLHEPGAVASIQRLAQRHDCIVLHLEDPAERGRLRGGVFRGLEAETGRDFVAHGRSRWFAGRTPPEESLRSAGIDYLRLGTDRPFAVPLRYFLASRGGLVRNTR